MPQLRRRSVPAIALCGLFIFTSCGQDPAVDEPTSTSSAPVATSDLSPGTTTPTVDTTSGDQGGQVGDLSDYVDLALALAPPNGEEASRIDGEGSVHVSWRSPDSPDALRGHYEALFVDRGLSISSTLDPPCCFWGFTTSNPPAAGSIQLTEDGDGSTVTVLSSQTG